MKVRNWVAGSLIAIGMTWSGPSLAYNHNFWLHNDTDRTINGVWLSVKTDSIWHHVSGNVISPGYRTMIEFNNQNGPCNVQLRIKFTDGTYHEWNDGFNVCSITDIEIKWDDNSGSYTADYYSE